MPKLGFPIFGTAGLLPKLVRSRLDLLLAGFGHGVSPDLEHGPTFMCGGGLTAGPCWASFGDWPAGFKSARSRWFLADEARAKQRPCGRYTAWPLPGLSRSSRRFRRR